MSPVETISDRTLARLAEAELAHTRRNPRSRAAVEDLGRWLPGGDTRAATWYDPFPLVIDHAAGVEMFDLDGHRLLDFIGNYTSLIHGHAPAAVTRAIAAGLERGSAFAAPLEEQAELAKRLIGRIRSIEQVRFTNSGTEANMLAARIARAITGRRRFAVARHSYHGSWDVLDWTQADATGTAVFDTGDPDAAVGMLGDGRDLAAIFIEPVLGSGGVISLSDEFLRALREYSRSCGALLVFDEVMSFRLGYGGRQEAVELTPDLTTLAKIIGGGLPIGAVGGAASVMDVTSPANPAPILHSGTFNGNRLAMSAGAAALDMLDRAAIDRIGALAGRLRHGIGEAARRCGLPIAVTGCGSLLNLHALPDVESAEDAHRAAQQPLRRLLHLALLEHGVFIAPRGEMCTSTPMDEATIDEALGSIGDAFESLT